MPEHEATSEFREFLRSKRKGDSWSDDQLVQALAIAKKESSKEEGADLTPGRMMIDERKWLNIWTDQDVDGNVYTRYGIAVGSATTGSASSKGDDEQMAHR